MSAQQPLKEDMADDMKVVVVMAMMMMTMMMMMMAIVIMMMTMIMGATDDGMTAIRMTIMGKMLSI